MTSYLPSLRVPGLSNRTFGNRTKSTTPIVRLGLLIEQNRTFDYRTVGNHTQSNLPSITELLFVYITDILYGAPSP